jgi:YD repeat-containing protein
VYNRQGQVAELKDQNGTVHAYEYDLAGRRTADKVTAFGSAIDQTVQRIDVAFADRGGLARVSSRSGTSGTSTVVNEVARSYNAFGQLFQEKQDHAAAVGTGTPLVGYFYADGADNHARPTRIEYPDGRKVHFSYGAADGTNDLLSRVAAICDDDSGSPGMHLAEYTYLVTVHASGTDLG